MMPLTQEEFMFIWEKILGQKQAQLEYAKYAIWLLYNSPFFRRIKNV